MDDREILDRQSIRLAGYDYRRGGEYFVTVCTHEQNNHFGEVVDDEVRLSRWGEIADECWRSIPEHFPRTKLDRYVVMPNHLHGILVVGAQHAVPIPESGRRVDPGSATTASGDGNGIHVPERAQHAVPLQIERPSPSSLAVIIRSFKASVTKRINELTGTTRQTIWQRNYYEHIIRSDDDLYNTRRYIHYNPAKWKDGGQDW